MEDIDSIEGDRSAITDDLDRSGSVTSTVRGAPARTSQEFSSLAQGFSRQAQIEAAELEELAERIKKLQESRRANEEQAKVNKQNARNQQFEEDLAARKAETLQMLSPHILRAVAYRLGTVDDDADYIRAVASGEQKDRLRLLALLFKEMFSLESSDLVEIAKTVNNFASHEINDKDLEVVANAFGCLKPHSIAEDCLTYEPASPLLEDGTQVTTPTRLKMTEIDDGLEPATSPKPSFAFLEHQSEREAVDKLSPISGCGQIIKSKDADREESDSPQRIEVTSEMPSDAVTKNRAANPPVSKKKDKSAATSMQGSGLGEPGTSRKRAREESSEVSVKSQDSVPKMGKRPREDGELTKRNQKFIKSVEKVIRSGKLNVLTLDCGSCKSEAVDPRVTRCNHIYCVKCIREMQSGLQPADASKIQCTHLGCGKKIGKVGVVSPEIIEQLKQKHARGDSDSIDADDDDESTKSTVDEA